MTPTRAVTVVALALVLLTPGANLTAQFRARTDLVEFGAVVLDRNGDPVPGLSQADFEVIEDGHPVPVSTFLAINADQPATVDDGRFLALLVEARSNTARKLARDLIDRMGERDVVALLAVNGSKATTTDDRQVALKQLEDLNQLGAVPARSGRSGPFAIDATPSSGCSECGGSVALPWEGYNSTNNTANAGGRIAQRAVFNVLNQMEGLADQLKKIPHRRKSIIYIGPGSTLNLTQRDILESESGRWFDVITHASRANVSVSVIGVDGLMGGSFAGARMLAEQTGGDAIVDTNVFGPGIERLWQHAGQYYLLGYAPGSAKKKRHSIEVRVKRPDLEVHALKTRG